MDLKNVKILEPVSAYGKAFDAPMVISVPSSVTMKGEMMKRFLVVAFLAAVPSWTFAQDASSTEQNDVVVRLLQKIEALEKRVAELEKQQNATAPAKPEEQKELEEEPKPEAKANSQSNPNGIIELNPQLPNYLNLPELLEKYPNLNRPRSRTQNSDLDGMLEGMNNGIPSNWARRSFNGFTYYVVPLAHQPSRGVSTMNAR